ncbi:hypothetical protein D3C73_1508250 [compost metagenome]
MIQVQIKHQCTMAEHATTCGKLGITRNFLFSHLQIVPPSQFGINPQFLQGFNYRLSELAEIVEGLTVILRNEAEIEVAQIVVDCATSG